MEVKIYSREAIKKLLKNDFPENVAEISFYKSNRVFHIAQVSFWHKPLQKID